MSQLNVLLFNTRDVLISTPHLLLQTLQVALQLQLHMIIVLHIMALYIEVVLLFPNLHPQRIVRSLLFVNQWLNLGSLLIDAKLELTNNSILRIRLNFIGVGLIIYALEFELCVFKLGGKFPYLCLQLIDIVLSSGCFVLGEASLFSRLFEFKLDLLNFKLKVYHLLLVKAVCLQFGDFALQSLYCGALLGVILF